MKQAIILLFCFMFVSCVTANTENRELSGVNPEPVNESDSIEKPLMVADYGTCVKFCTDAGGESSYCRRACGCNPTRDMDCQIEPTRRTGGE